MKRTPLFLAAVFFLATGSLLAASRSVDWLLKDAYEEEYVPLSQVAVTMPADVRAALESYHGGNFRKTVEILEKLRALKLPDGRLDFVTFVLAESYRKLGCAELARRDYHYIADNFPASDNVAPALYRLQEFGVENDDPETVDSVYGVFEARYRRHPLMNSVAYLGGLSHYQRKEYDKAIQKLLHIPGTSSHSAQAQFLSAQCYLQTKDFQKALIALAAIRSKVKKGDLADEAAIMIGDIYSLQNNAATALTYYRQIPASAKRFPYALLKAARCNLDLGNYEECVKTAREFIHDNRNSQYYFEMASVLEKGYAKLGNQKGSAQVGSLIRGQIVNARLAFEIYDEINRLTDLLQSWQRIEHRAVRDGQKPLQDQAIEQTKQLRELEKRYYAVLKEVAPAGIRNSKEVPYQAERRYLAILKAQRGLIGDTLGDMEKRFEATIAGLKASPDDTGLARKADSVGRTVDTLKARSRECVHEYELVLRECIGNDRGNREADEGLQAKFVDWVFVKYQENKELLKRVTTQIAARKKTGKKAAEQKGGDSLSKSTVAAKAPPAGEKEYNEGDRDRLVKQIADDREHLESHIKTILDVYPKSAYNSQILFRLAELYFDAAGDEFQTALKAYEQKMAQGKDTAGIEFPEYKLDNVLAAYDAIIDNYPHGDITDGAYFYKALALQKLGRDEEGNKVLLSLIGKFPQSEYFVEANMNIGKYYFDHPKIANGRGYKMAEEAYRRVLFYRDHPQYVSALYQLGWCYYMQDRYDDAIAVFKYLVEGSHLDFDPLKMDEKQLSNPLLRGEAIDYIAISFDAENKIDTAIQFLKLVGNSDYAAIVLKRIGELREEDLDFNAAMRVYKRLLVEYPNSREAPRTYVSLIKLYESRDKLDSAMLLREEFLARYTRGGEWQKAVADSALFQTVDSMAISNGLYVADVTYRRADSTKNRDDYARAAKNYQRLVESYPADPRAAEALWNLAVILDLKLLDKPQAFDRYVAFSRLTAMDSSRREQAALNAIAIAQGLLPPDSSVQKGTIEFAASKVVDAVNNYAELFPNGKSWGKVMLGLGAIYFNRHLFSNAAKIYERIVGRGVENDDYYEALSFLGQCHYGEENWPGAVDAFEKIWKKAPDQARRSAAYKLLLQSEFLNAKRFLAAGDFVNAADRFSQIEEKYPKSEYGDIALFNAAEALEKIQQWDKACDRYADLVGAYPGSKLASDALFNAAGNFEKNNRYDKAVEAYETIAQNYPYAEKAKDALFNVGFCYEKMGKADKMAEANERYSAHYPGEKDVEAMMLRSAAFYAKAKMYERAISVYRTFIKRYPRSAKVVEADFMIAKCAYDQGDMGNALAGFTQTEQQNIELAKANQQNDNYYAGEAAYYTGLIKREKFLAVKLALPDDRLKRSLKEKSDLLTEAAKAFQRVMQYRSERIFEAAYRVGQLYEDLSTAWKDQERPSLDPIKAALLDKDIFILSSGLLQKSFIPYQKGLELAKGFDSLGAEQKIWILKSENSLKKDFVDAGDLLLEGVSAMSSAPVPKEIREQPLFYYQYQKQLVEALLPLKEQVRQYYTVTLSLCDSLALAGEEVDTCRSKFAYVNYFIGEGYDHLAAQILRNSKEAAKDLPQDQKEDLIFQLEDIVYEVQDKAIFAYEEGLARIKKANIPASSWAHRIIESLARLSPDKYGASYYSRTTVASDNTWIVREDSVGDWNAVEPPRQGWRRADMLPSVKPLELRAGTSRYLWGSVDAPRAYLWKNVFLAGTPRSAAMYVSTIGAYRLFVNGTLILSDTVGNRSREKIDSATGIATVLKGGDNSIAAEIRTADPAEVGAAILFSAMIDTSEHFKSSVKLPAAATPSPAPQGMGAKPETAPAIERPAAPDTARTAPQLPQREAPQVKPAAPSYVTRYRNRGELLLAIDNYNNREIELNKDIKKERVAIQSAEIERDNLDSRIRQVRAAVDSLKAKAAGASKKKDGVVKEKPVPAAQKNDTGKTVAPKINADTTVKIKPGASVDTVTPKSGVIADTNTAAKQKPVNTVAADTVGDRKIRKDTVAEKK
jgi:cellulose synthase operon protein C